MEKDKKWLKGLINEEGIVMNMNLLGRHDEQYWKNENIKINKGRLFYLIDQLDEPEVNQLDKKIRELESYNDELIRDNNQLRNALDNQEVLSQEWIDEQEQCITGHGADKNGMRQYHHAPFVSVDDLQNLLVPKQELPVIPNFVAEWIEKYVEYGYDLYPALKKMENNARSWERTYYWYRNNTLEFVLAYLTQEYEVEKEKNYEVIIGRGTKSGLPSVVALYKSAFGRMVIKELFEEDYEESKQRVPTSFWLTEKEIKTFDKRYWAFAEEVKD